ncbi:MAG: flagellar biosynthesis anti-sigma factor FlgM [Planctomycetota bacterium]|jgi:hypothetical protein
MPDIPSIGHGSLGPVNRTAGPSAYQGTTRARDHGHRLGDRVELSEHARLLDRLRQMPDVRIELVEKVRRTIAEGTYETPEKLESAVQQLLAELRAG